MYPIFKLIIFTQQPIYCTLFFIFFTSVPRPQSINNLEYHLTQAILINNKFAFRFTKLAIQSRFKTRTQLATLTVNFINY
jgi:hypothetical protein